MEFHNALPNIVLDCFMHIVSIRLSTCNSHYVR